MKHVVVVEPASSGIEFVQAAQRRGFTPVVLTGQDGEAESIEKARHLGARILAVDFRKTAEVLALLAEVPEIVAVLPGMEYYVETAALLAHRLGLPGIGIDIARRFRDKHAMRQHLAAAGVAVPAFTLLDETSFDHASEKVAGVGFPAVLKPVDGAGSLGVRKVNTLHELSDAVRAGAEERIVDLGHSVGKKWMLESYISGPEFSLEGVVTSEGCRILAVTEKLLGPEPFFVEIGHIVEARLRPEERRALISYTEAIVAILGLRLGAFHAEVRLSPNGPRLIEVAARLGGDHIPYLVELVTGVSLADLALDAHLAGEFRHCYTIPDQNKECGSPSKVAGIRFFTKSQLLGSGVACDFRDRISHIVCVAENYELLAKQLDDGVRTFLNRSKTEA